MQISDLIEEVALHVGDPAFAQVTKAQWLTFAQSAARDMYAAGWLLPINDDSSLVVASNTFVYNVPANFAYIAELRAEEIQSGISVFTREIPRNHWTVRLQANAPVIVFYTLSSLENGRKIMVIGQKRPTVYGDAQATVDQGIEAFMRERMVAYGARFSGAGVSELARWRQVVSGTAWQASDRILRLMPQEFRMIPSSIIVPTREV